MEDSADFMGIYMIYMLLKLWFMRVSWKMYVDIVEYPFKMRSSWDFDFHGKVYDGISRGCMCIYIYSTYNGM